MFDDHLPSSTGVSGSISWYGMLSSSLPDAIPLQTACCWQLCSLMFAKEGLSSWRFPTRSKFVLTCLVDKTYLDVGAGAIYLLDLCDRDGLKGHVCYCQISETFVWQIQRLPDKHWIRTFWKHIGCHLYRNCALGFFSSATELSA